METLKQLKTQMQDTDHFIWAIQKRDDCQYLIHELYKWDIEKGNYLMYGTPDKYPSRGWFTIADDFYKNA